MSCGEAYIVRVLIYINIGLLLEKSCTFIFNSPIHVYRFFHDFSFKTEEMRPQKAEGRNVGQWWGTSVKDSLRLDMANIPFRRRQQC